MFVLKSLLLSLTPMMASAATYDPYALTIEGEGGEGGGGGDSTALGGAGEASQAGGGEDSQSGGSGSDSSSGGTESGETKGGEGEDSTKGAAGDDAVPDTYAFTLPDGFEGELDTEAVALAEPIFRELGLSQDKADKLIGLYAQVFPKATEKVLKTFSDLDATTRADWLTEAKADKDIGGAKWDESMVYAAKALDRLGYAKGTPFRQLLDTSGLGNHPEMIRAFRKIGELVGEDGDFVRTGAGGPVSENPARVMYPNNKPKE